MSSYLSNQPITYNQTQSSVNIPLQAQVLAMKEGKYNAAQVQIQQALDAFGGVNMLRDADKEYLAGKLNDITSDINNSGNRDLSKSYVASNLMAKVRSIAQDPVVLDAVESTKNYMSFQKNIEEIKEKKPELYHDSNYQFALYEAGFKDYMEGKTNKLKSVNYTPFKDVDKKMNDFVLELEKASKEQKIQIPDGKGGMVETTVGGLSPEKLKQVASSMLDSSDLKQMEIDGWVASNGYQNTAILGQAKDYLVQQNKTVQAKIDALQVEIDNGGLSAEDKKEKESLIGNYKTSLVDENSMSTMRQAATYLQQIQTIENTVKRFEPLYFQNQVYKKDEVYFAQEDLKLKKAEFEYKIQQDEKKKRVEPTGEVIVSNTITEYPDIPNIEEKVDSEIDKYKTSTNTYAQQFKVKVEALATQGDKEAKALMGEFKAEMAKKSAGESDLDVFTRVARRTVKTNSGLRIINNDEGVPTNYIQLINSNQDKYKKLLQGKVEATKQAEIEHVNATVNNQETFSAFYNNKDTKMLWTNTEGKIVATPVYKVLQANHLMDANGKKVADLTDPKYRAVLDGLKKSYYADKLLSEQHLFGAGKQIRIDSKNDISKLSSLFNESIGMVAKEIKLANNAGTQYIINPNSKTGQFLLESQKRGLFEQTNPIDQSLTKDDSTIARFVTKDYKDSATYKSKIQSLYGKLPSNMSVGVVPTDKQNFTRLLNIAKSASSENPTAINDVNNTINLSLDGDYVVLSQIETGEKKSKIETTTRIPKVDFIRNAPDLARKLNFETEASFYTVNRVSKDDLVSEPIKFFTPETSSKNFKYASKVLLNNDPTKATFLRKEDAIKNITDSYPELSTEISKAIENSSNFSINGEVNKDFDGSAYLTLYLKDKNGKVITSTDIENLTDVDNFKNIIDEAPQVYYGMFVKDIMSKQNSSKILYEKDSEVYQKLMESLNK